METLKVCMADTPRHLVFSLPMRDGNKYDVLSFGFGVLVFSLPMRDGNHILLYHRRTPP